MNSLKHNLHCLETLIYIYVNFTWKMAQMTKIGVNAICPLFLSKAAGHLVCIINLNTTFNLHNNLNTTFGLHNNLNITLNLHK